MPFANKQNGFSLMEVTIAIFLSVVLTSGIASLLGSSVSAYRQQLSQGQLEESSRFARDILASHISQAGYQPRPWQNPAGLEAVTNAQGRPEFYLLQTRFQVNPSNNLAMTCRYGPDASQLTTQLNNFGLVENIAAMQVLYARDSDGDGVVDGWVKAGDWPQEDRILAVKIALLSVSGQAFNHVETETITLLDETITTPADGRLRSVSTLLTAIRGRLK